MLLYMLVPLYIGFVVFEVIVNCCNGSYEFSFFFKFSCFLVCVCFLCVCI